MADREHLELLASRLLDGDLSASEQAEAEAALAAEPQMAGFAASIRRVHDRLTLLAERRLPRDFTERVMQGIAVESPQTRILSIQRSSWRQWAAAAAVLLTVGVLVGAGVMNGDGRPAEVDKLALNVQPTGEVGPVNTYRGPGASVVAFSEGELEVVSQQGRNLTSRFEGHLALPAEVSAPAESYAVIEVAGGTAVLSPGARARLADMDLDGTPDFEPIDGDLYLESAGKDVQSRIGEVSLNTQGGVTLRRIYQGYRAEPSHGVTRAGLQSFSHRQWVSVANGAVLVSDGEAAVLDDWAIRGRADAIKVQLRRLLGPSYDRIPARHWQQFDKLLRGVLSRPWERATYAYMIRFLLKYDFIENATSEEKEVWGTIAGILAEGTTAADVPVQIRDLITQAEEGFAQDPQQLENFKALVRDSMERASEAQGEPPRRD